MQRYFIPSIQMETSKAVIQGDDAKHITKVMRMEIGSRLVVLNNEGRAAVGVISSFNDGGEVWVDLEQEEQKNSELPVKAAIAQALVKGDKLDYIVQKSTELGVSVIYIYQAERSVVKWDQAKAAKKIERLQKIAKEAAEQSERRIIPQVMYCENTSKLMKQAASYEECMVIDEEEARSGSHSALSESLSRSSNSDSSFFACIGPEGGISEKEKLSMTSSGFYSVSLGPRILRSETASSYFLAVLSYHFELMR
ncbi:16S rRNA (uracil(1498)-N(3))-methyltransferase [Sinobaca sp. H24]|uniref:RsmE family RNA methyltransferase n=1 Tax=Sinobaca sp. H24 TaxID=2923376 RepID=UPI00207A73C6|nr:RsmE family RNA methyltransferase [Sinobaca sp. H24]